ncbi:hypothetical protein ACSSS7_005284 [Eimeria intestinalis]
MAMPSTAAAVAVAIVGLLLRRLHDFVPPFDEDPTDSSDSSSSSNRSSSSNTSNSSSTSSRNNYPQQQQTCTPTSIELEGLHGTCSFYPLPPPSAAAVAIAAAVADAEAQPFILDAHLGRVRRPCCCCKAAQLGVDASPSS